MRSEARYAPRTHSERPGPRRTSRSCSASANASWMRNPAYTAEGAELGDVLRTLVDVLVAERAQRVEHLVVHLRAGERVAPRRRGDLGVHVRRVLVQQHVVAVVLLGEQGLELGHGLG